MSNNKKQEKAETKQEPRVLGAIIEDKELTDEDKEQAINWRLGLLHSRYVSSALMSDRVRADIRFVLDLIGHLIGQRMAEAKYRRALEQALQRTQQKLQQSSPPPVAQPVKPTGIVLAPANTRIVRPR